MWSPPRPSELASAGDVKGQDGAGASTSAAPVANPGSDGQRTSLSRMRSMMRSAGDKLAADLKNMKVHVPRSA